MVLFAFGNEAVADSSGSNAAELLRVGYGARVPALGGSIAAGADGADAAWYNPAGLTRLKGKEATGSYQSLVESINQGTLGYAMPINERLGLGVVGSYINYGSQDRTTVSTAGAFTTVNRSGSQFDAYDLTAGLALGYRISPVFSIGGAAKLVSSKLDNASATAFSGDLGVEWKEPTLPLTIGAGVRNLGTKLKFDLVEEELPLTFYAGAELSLFDDRFSLYASTVKVDEEKFQFRGGVELRVVEMLSLRAGYDGANNSEGTPITAGIGVNVNDLTLDYAYVPFGAFGNNHRVALTYRWGPAGGE